MPSVGPVATSLPRHRLSQDELREAADALLPESPGKAAILDVFGNARIDSRAIAMPIGWYAHRHGFAERNQAYVDVGLPLAEEAARGAMEAARLGPQDVDGVVLVSTTGIATPSLDARLANRLGLRRGVARVPLFGLGCAGGVAGLARAADLAGEGRKVLLVALELCTLSFDVATAIGATRGRKGDGPDKKSLVAASLFGDGCAATVVSGDGVADGLRFVAGSSHLFPDSERVMGWDVADDHLEVVLSPGIPDLVEREMAGVVSTVLREHNGGRPPDHWILHPGGARVIDAYRKSLGLGGDELRHTEEVLRRHGNMSSPTALFVLGAAQKEGKVRAGDRLLVGALGPGFAGEFALLEA